MKGGSRQVSMFLAHFRCVIMSLALTAFALPMSPSAFALTVRTKSDLRLWETAMDRSRPLSWSWETGADAACLTFSNRLTRSVSSETVVREPGAVRGSCPHPVALAADEALVVATLTQMAEGVAIACETAEIAYVPGASGRPTSVRTKAARDWRSVRSPRLSAFDARWWNVTGPSGYEVLWAEPAGPHRVVREFEGMGVVDETVLRFGMPGFMLLLR